jgi:YbbR domain-containing protein
MIGFFKRYVLHNFGLKLVSVLLATGLWFIISRDEQPAEVAVHAPVVFENVPANLEVSSESIPETLIRVRGPERAIRQLRANEVQAALDLAGSTPDQHTFNLTTQLVRHPRELTVVQIVPSQLHIAFDTHFSREVEVHPRITVADDEQIVKYETDPAHVTIGGPRRHVERVDAATTDSIDASGTLGSGVFNTTVYVTDPLVHVDQATSIRVTVTVQKTTPH